MNERPAPIPEWELAAVMHAEVCCPLDPASGCDGPDPIELTYARAVIDAFGFHRKPTLGDDASAGIVAGQWQSPSDVEENPC